MTKPTHIALHDDARDQVIDRLYDVALDPARYGALVDHWEDLIAPLRKDAGDGAFTLNDDLIQGHFDRASKFLDRWAANRQRQGVQALLDGFDHSAALLINDQLTITALNEPAQNTLGVRAEMALSNLPLESSDLEHFEREARGMFENPQDRRAMLQFRAVEDGRFIVFHVMRRDVEGEAPLLLAITSELHWPKGFSALLKSSFGFTSAEADVARGLVECCSVRDIAETRSRSIETVRAQVKSVLSKTETRSQTEAVRLLLSMMDIATFTLDRGLEVPAASGGFRKLTTVPFQTLFVGGGRRLDYLVLGDAEGRPVVYHPGDYGLVRWPASAEADLARRGIRLIVPVRAGYGASSEPAKGAGFTETVCADLAAVMDACGVESCPVVAQGSDSFIAISMTHFQPGRTTAIIACSGVLPLTRSEQFERMEKWHRFINSSARYTPHLTPFMVKAGFFLARRIGKRGFIHAAYGNTPADVETFEQPEAFEAIVTGSDVALSEEHSAHKSFAANVLDMERGDWTDRVEALKGAVPVIFMSGLQDPQVPVLTLREHQADYPWIRFEEFEDGGQLLLFRHWRRVIDHLEKFLP